MSVPQLMGIIRKFPPDKKDLADREGRRAYVEDIGWGLSREEWAKIDELIDQLDRWKSEEHRATAEMILVGLTIGTNADKVARVMGINRDKFVRPRAKRLRSNGIWVHGTTALNPAALAEDAPDSYMLTELLLITLVAEGFVEATR